MKNKQLKPIFGILAIFGLIFVILTVLNACVPTFANVPDLQEAEEITEFEEIEIPFKTGVAITVKNVSDDDSDEKNSNPDMTVEKEEWPERVVFLTFDDGPSQNTGRLLDTLYEENVPATFFLLGESMLERTTSYNRVIIERILREGHYVGLHSMTHLFSELYTGYGAAGRFVAEMQQLQDLIYETAGHKTNLCRAPFGMMSGFTALSGHREAIAEAGIKCIDWNVDPDDWDVNNSSQDILDSVIRQVEKMEFPSEVVIVLHERNVTIDALPAMIAFFREHDYVFKAYQPGHEFIYLRYQ